MNLEELQKGKVILIDKPLEWTSFDVVNKVRWNIRKAFKVKKFKVGHAGTLDPKATGLLLLCVGKFTKKISELQGMPKVYTGTIKLGATTPSYDTETAEENITTVPDFPLADLKVLTEQFTGDIEQFPPVHSAIKKDGKRLYEYARKGEAVEVPKRTVHIHSFTITNWNNPTVEFEVKCSKGTYIRSLAHDFQNPQIKKCKISKSKGAFS